MFLTHRQMGLSEPFMKIFPNMKLKDSNISSVFVPLGKKEEISRYLLRADPELNYHDKELFEINDREGLYYEKQNWTDKYLRRDMSEWSELCLPQYVKMYDPTNKEEKDIEDGSVKVDDVIEDDAEANKDVLNEESEIFMGQDDDGQEKI